MTLRLVSEARPIQWEHLTKGEQTLMHDADGWLQSVIDAGKNKRPCANEIDSDRSGRVLFIDGQRGAGKTSFLLTLLQRWRGRVTGDGAPKLLQPDQVKVLLPILDFDPLPREMPLHGWLLEPWRKLAKEYENQGTHGSKGNDLSELRNEVFERAVIGWTSAATPGKGVVEHAIQYQEQASGWIDTREVWHNLVNAMVCASLRCSDDPEKCKKTHPRVFVIAIDDVDLQVEHLPQLLHAIRLLHHPNVAYVLTGDRIHMELALELDYLARHARCAGAWSVQKDDHEDLRQRITTASTQLRKAFLEKALPEHARLHLPMLNAAEVLKLAVRNNQGKEHPVSAYLHHDWSRFFKQVDGLPISTARRAHHALERHLGNAALEDVAASIEFVADLCGTLLERKKNSDSAESSEKPQFLISGRLTTYLGSHLRVWDGDRLKVTLRDRPLIAFLAAGETVPRFDDDAIRPLVLHLAVEHKHAHAHALAWNPDAGILTTEVEWSPGTPAVASTAVFHWPWLVRPPATAVLELGDLARSLSGLSPDPGLSSLSENFVARWLLKNIGWFCDWFEERKASLPGSRSSGGGGGTDFCANSHNSQDDGDQNTLDDFEQQLKRLVSDVGADNEAKREITDWAAELYVMTTPYFGLPTEMALKLRAIVETLVTADPSKSQTTKEDRLRVEQNRMIGDAITARLVPPRTAERREDPSGGELEILTTRFLEQQNTRSEADTLGIPTVQQVPPESSSESKKGTARRKTRP